MDLFDVYSEDFPSVLRDFANTKDFNRLKDIGMHCGCEYTSFRAFSYIKDYSRWEHSIGVGLIVWHFTKDIKQAVAGLLHDISTPAFAHVIDFLNKDYISQESTEDDTRDFIENSGEFSALMEKYGLETNEISDYHLYPIADNDMPGLSADRLEYHLGNFLCRGMLTKEEIANVYGHLVVVKNEKGVDELAFDDIQIAKQFVDLYLENSRLFVCDEDRFSMEYLARLVKYGIEAGAISKEDLYSVEKNVINKLCNNDKTKALWEKYTSFSKIYNAIEKPEEEAFKVNAKKRYVVPLVKVDGLMQETDKKASEPELEKNTEVGEDATKPVFKRITEIDADAKRKIDEFLSTDFDRWIYAK